ncbi:tail fiber protein [Sinomicrobium kalidii]|uniref:tail fiber protein n=1 Tax=Sinomicrobium kalidii TaxID=2900738 RepID=UPI001E2CD787|nr:tail fiber protein [Sinomicrobium kalidii]UGU17908.1 tail fiber protein [Sinomicrobium kalidii]
MGSGPVLRLSSGIATANKNVVFTVENNGNVGIGTTAPDGKLHVSSGTDGDAIFLLEADKDNSNEADNPLIQLRQDGDIIGVNMGFSENFGENIFGIGTRNTNTYGEKWDNFVINTTNGNVGIGTASPDAKLAVNGIVHSKEVKVDLNGWSDFVFKKEYNLPTLEEVEQHIKEKGHLKDIPGAEEVRENGIYLGEMDAKLLQKIEELTLYVIELKKENRQMRREIDELKKQ